MLYTHLDCNRVWIFVLRSFVYRLKIIKRGCGIFKGNLILSLKSLMFFPKAIWYYFRRIFHGGAHCLATTGTYWKLIFFIFASCRSLQEELILLYRICQRKRKIYLSQAYGFMRAIHLNSSSLLLLAEIMSLIWYYGRC